MRNESRARTAGPLAGATTLDLQILLQYQVIEASEPFWLGNGLSGM
jgi:hypothetical protein